MPSLKSLVTHVHGRDRVDVARAEHEADLPVVVGRLVEAGAAVVELARVDALLELHLARVTPTSSARSAGTGGKTRTVSRPSSRLAGRAERACCPGARAPRASGSMKRSWRTTTYGPLSHSSPATGVSSGMPFAAQAAATARSAIRSAPRAIERASAMRSGSEARAQIGAPSRSRATASSRRRGSVAARAVAAGVMGVSARRSVSDPRGPRPRRASRGASVRYAGSGPLRASRASPRAASSRGRGCRTSRCRGSRTAGRRRRARTGRAGRARWTNAARSSGVKMGMLIWPPCVWPERQRLGRSSAASLLARSVGPWASTSGVGPPVSPVTALRTSSRRVR